MDEISNKDLEFLVKVKKSLMHNVQYPGVFGRGELIYSNQRIYNFEVEDYTEYFIVSGQLDSSNRRKVYDCHLRIEKDGSIKGESHTECSCPFSGSFPGICKHRVALGLWFIDCVMNGYKYDDSSFSSTSRPLYDYLMQFRDVNNELKQHKLQNHQKEPDEGTVKLIPELTLYAHDYINYCTCFLKMQVKLNDSRAYVVKNVNEFVENVLQNRFFIYGKSLEFIHTYEALDDKSKKLNVCFCLDKLQRKNEETW